MKKAIAFIALTVALIASGFAAVNHLNWSSSKIEMTKRDGEKLVNALHSYANDNGKYPRNLNDLVPNYMPYIPHPRAGSGDWYYMVQGSKSTAFDLGFQQRKDFHRAPRYSWDQRNRVWTYDDGGM